MTVNVLKAAVALIACTCLFSEATAIAADRQPGPSGSQVRPASVGRAFQPRFARTGVATFARNASAEPPVGADTPDHTFASNPNTAPSEGSSTPAPRGGVPGVCGTVTECQNADCTTVDPLASIACTLDGGLTTADNNYARCILIPNDMELLCVDIGVESNDPVLSYDVTIVISRDIDGCPPTAPGGVDLITIDSRVVTIPPAIGPGFFTITYNPPLILPAGPIVVELLAPSATGVQAFFVGSNVLEPSGVTYISAPIGCSLPNYVDVRLLNPQNDKMNWVVRLDGNALGTNPGTCCFPDGSCQFLIPVDCLTQGGDFAGGPGCTPNPCPQIPTNDTCSTALGLTVPSSITADTFLATPDPFPGTCGTSVNNGGAGLWYAVFGTGNTMTASTCNPGTDFDTQLSVSCGDCTCLVCIDGNDNDPACAAGPQRGSTVSWCSAFGATYLIFVHSFDPMVAGNFELSIADDGVPCATPPSCTRPPEQTCVQNLPPAQVAEAELCGQDTNGGCNNLQNMPPTPETFTEIGVDPCPTTVGGTVWFDGATRDTDWFKFSLTQDHVMRVCLIPEFPVQIGFLELDPIIGDCNLGGSGTFGVRSVNGGFSSATGGACVPTCVQTDDCLPPGNYVLFVAPQLPDGALSCSSTCRFGNDYFGTLECLQCLAPCCINNFQCPFLCTDLTPNQCQAQGGTVGGTLLQSCFDVPNVCSPGPAQEPDPCCKGDTNADGLRDGQDVVAFVDHVLNQNVMCGPGPLGAPFCGTDMNDDGLMNVADAAAFVTALLGGPCPVPCNANPNQCQLPDQLAHGIGGSLCVFADANPAAGGTGVIAADDFRPSINGDITSICWWGVYTNGSAPCLPATGDSANLFDIRYYSDNLGTPGTLIAEFLDVAPAGMTVTGNVLAAGIGNLEEIEFTATHAPVTVTAGTCYWIGIQGKSTASCFFCWSTAPAGNTRSVQTQNPPFTAGDLSDFDLTFCLNVDIAAGGFCVPIGACCNIVLPICTSGLTEAQCADASHTWFNGADCADPLFNCPPPVDCGTTLVTQNTDPNTITPGTSVSCNDQGTPQTNEDSYYARLFTTGTLTQVRCVNFGVEAARDSTVGQLGAPVEVRIYEDTNGVAPGDLPGETDLVLLGTALLNIPDAATNQFFQAVMTPPIDVSATSFFVVEIFTPSGHLVEPAGTNIFLGANSAGQTAPAYLKAPQCGIATFTNIGTLCVPCLNSHMLISAQGL
ncbi:MAG: hypothetical protein ACE5F9_07675 [Phycisphaerae bacterium]